MLVFYYFKGDLAFLLFFVHKKTEQTFYAVIILLDFFLSSPLFFFQLFACPSFRSLACNIFFCAESELATRKKEKKNREEKEEDGKKVSISLQSKVPPHYKSLFRLFNYISQNELRYRQEKRERERERVNAGGGKHINEKRKVLQTKS